METTFQPVNFNMQKSLDADKIFKDFDISKPSHSYSNKTSLADSFEKIQKNQGWFAKKWDGLKNFLGMKSGSSNVENIIAKSEIKQIDEETAKKAVEKYAAQQACVSRGILNFLSSMLVIGVSRIPCNKKTKVALSVLTGILSRVGLGALEASTNQVNGDYTIKNGLKDVAFGAVIGGIGAFGKLKSYKLEDKLSLSMLKFAIMNIIATGGQSLSFKNSLAFRLANSNLFNKINDNKQSSDTSK